MLKNNIFSALIFEGFGRRFGKVFGRFFEPEMHENCERTILSKTLKLVILLRENWYFQGFDVSKFEKPLSKSVQNFHAFLDLDFEGILGGILGGLDI